MENKSKSSNKGTSEWKGPDKSWYNKGGKKEGTGHSQEYKGKSSNRPVKEAAARPDKEYPRRPEKGYSGRPDKEYANRSGKEAPARPDKEYSNRPEKEYSTRSNKNSFSRGAKDSSGQVRGDRQDRPRQTSPSANYTRKPETRYTASEDVSTENVSVEREDTLIEGDVIAGRNAVIEALRSERSIDVVYLSEPDSGNAGMSGVMGKIRSLARDAGVVVKSATKEKLSQLTGGVHHQGIVAVCSCAAYAGVEDILAEAARKGTVPFLLIADEIEDPHNLGAIIRTAEACGADGLILPKRRSASLNATVYKTSAGAASVLKVARVSNLVNCIKELKKQNIWIFGADMEGTSWSKLDFSVPCALVIGSEGKGISRLLREECDYFPTLPMSGQINSLNASVAAAILMYEVVRQRLG